MRRDAGSIPEFTDPDVCLALMDRMHIGRHRELPDPGVALIEVNFMDDPVATQVLVHAFNQWMLIERGLQFTRAASSTPVM